MTALFPPRGFARSVVGLAAGMFVNALGQAADSAPALKRESFDRDPGWEAVNNRVVAAKPRQITQAFGYSPQTTFAGGQPGEIGGRVARAPELAFYGAKFRARTLDDKLSSSGTFTFTETGAGGGVFVGWFNDRQTDTARPMHSLGMNLDTENPGGRLAVRLITGTNQSCGEFVTTYIPGKFRPTPLRKGVRYRWTLDYDPAANGGNGRFVYTLTGHDSGEPIKTPISVDLPPGFKQQGTTFTRFGIMNMRKSGGSLSLYLDDVTCDGQHWDFSSDPQWHGEGNQKTFTESEPAGAHNFGFALTNFAGGRKGELGGSVWRTTPASYGDRVGPFTLEQPLVARGRVAFTGADPDSGAYFGWYRGDVSGREPRELREFVGVHVEGPTRVGHYFQPLVVTAKGSRPEPGHGPVLRPDGKPHQWTLAYDPAGNGGSGSMKVTLDEAVVSFDLPKGRKAEGARLDRFGLFSSNVGGSRVKIYLDDLEYSATPTR